MEHSTLLIILNLVIIESLLSVDNAAVLAVMVRGLPERDRARALRYGLFGAYFFRGLCLFFIGLLMTVYWLKIVGGLYLLYLMIGFFTSAKDTPSEIVKDSPGKEKKLFRMASRIGLSQFWATIVLVEYMDLVFSIDNVFAANALSDNFWVIMAGVAIGMLAMRFVAGRFEKLMRKYPRLEMSAFIVIGILGVKLIFSGSAHYVVGMRDIELLLEGHSFDLWFSGAMMLIFFTPIVAGLFSRKKNSDVDPMDTFYIVGDNSIDDP